MKRLVGDVSFHACFFKLLQWILKPPEIVLDLFMNEQKGPIQFKHVENKTVIVAEETYKVIAGVHIII